MDRFEYAFIADEFKGQIEWDIKNINISFIDIEVSSEYGLTHTRHGHQSQLFVFVS